MTINFVHLAYKGRKAQELFPALFILILIKLEKSDKILTLDGVLYIIVKVCWNVLTRNTSRFRHTFFIKKGTICK